MKRLGLMFLALALLARPAAADDSPGHELLSLAKAYLEARESTMQETARPADVDKALSSCAASMTYEHPRVGIMLTGVDAIRSGMLRFLGTSRNASIKTVASLEGAGMVAVQTKVAFEAKDDGTWRAVERQQVWVFEFDGSRIKRIIEYW